MQHQTSQTSFLVPAFVFFKALVHSGETCSHTHEPASTCLCHIHSTLLWVILPFNCSGVMLSKFLSPCNLGTWPQTSLMGYFLAETLQTFLHVCFPQKWAQLLFNTGVLRLLYMCPNLSIALWDRHRHYSTNLIVIS